MIIRWLNHLAMWKCLSLFCRTCSFISFLSECWLTTCHHWNLFPQYNRVWIPDAEHVWKSAEIRRDFHLGDNVLELLLEDGTVSVTMWPIKPSRATAADLWRWEAAADSFIICHCTGAQLPGRPVQTTTPSSPQPRHFGGGERPHSSQLPAWTRGPA